jgi:hypothetical protein
MAQALNRVRALQSNTSHISRRVFLYDTDMILSGLEAGRLSGKIPILGYVVERVNYVLK